MLGTELFAGLAERPTDLLRLVVVPAFAWAAWQDVQIRRVPNRLWPPLLALGLLLLVIDVRHFYALGGFHWQHFAIGVGISVFVVVPLVYGFWLLGGFGGADVKALATLAVLFPTFPTYYVGTNVLPAVDTHANAFAFTILSNAVVVGVAYPLAIGVVNVSRGDVSRWMLLGRRYRWDELPRVHGRLLETPDGFTRGGLDVDALRMYLRWRGLDLADLRERSEELRDPRTLPDDPNPPTDGAVATDGGRDVGGSGHGEDDGTGSTANEDDASGGGPIEEDAAAVGNATADANGTADSDAIPDGNATADEHATVDGDATADGNATTVDDAAGGQHGADEASIDDGADPWGAAAFLADIDHGAYGTDAETLRDGLDVVVDREEIWTSPGIPFIVPVFVGLLLALTYGDLLFGLLQWLGVA